MLINFGEADGGEVLAVVRRVLIAILLRVRDM